MLEPTAQRVRSNGPWGGSFCLLDDFLQVIKHHIMKTQMWLWTDPHGCRRRPSLLFITFIIPVSSTSSVAFRGFSVPTKLVDIPLPIWCNCWWNRKGKSELFVSGLFASLSSFSSALVPRCSLDVNPRFRTAVNIIPPNLKEHNWHLWFGLTMTKNQKEAWKGVNRLFKWAFLPNN